MPSEALLGALLKQIKNVKEKVKKKRKKVTVICGHSINSIQSLSQSKLPW